MANGAECLVWNDTVLTTNQVTDLLRAQRIKWEVVTLPAVVIMPTSSSSAPANTVLASVAADTGVTTTGSSLPASLPLPRCWLDAAHPGSLFSDAGGTVYAVPNGRVRVWHDRSGNGRHCTLTTGSWLTGLTDRVNRLPVVRIGSSPGTFALAPWDAGTVVASGFTVLAVWKVRADNRGGGGHPFSLNNAGVFGLSSWKEGLVQDLPDHTHTHTYICIRLCHRTLLAE
jgi:hypothetical protein